MRFAFLIDPLDHHVCSLFRLYSIYNETHDFSLWNEIETIPEETGNLNILFLKYYKLSTYCHLYAT